MGTGNPWAGHVKDTSVEVLVGFMTFMSKLVSFGFALETGSKNNIKISLILEPVLRLKLEHPLSLWC